MQRKSCLSFIIVFTLLLATVLSGCSLLGGLLGQAPTADAGYDGDSEVGAVINLDGSGSSGNGLEYSWRIMSYPPGATTAIANSGKMIASYTPTLPGEYVFTLTVKNSYGSDSAIVRYVVSSASNIPEVDALPGDRQVTISWMPVDGATSYFVYYKAGSTVTTTTGERYSTLQSPYNFTGLDNGTQYAFIVSAVTGTGESPASAVVTATPIAASTVPNAPVATATAGDGSVVITWTPVSGATSYNLYYLSGSTVTTTNGDRRALVVSPYTVSNLSNDTQYAFIVTAINAVGESSASATVTATPTVAITLPAAPVVTALAGDGMVTLSWAAVTTASSYYVYYNAGSSASKTDSRISSASSPKSVTGLTNSTQYAFVVTALNSMGEGPASEIVTATPIAPTIVTVPSSPTIQAIAGDGNVSISWQPVSGAVSYNLYYKEGSQVSKIDGIPIVPIPSSSPFILSDLNNGSQYAFIVTAVNAAGESLASNMTTATPIASATVPQAPANPVSVAGDGQITVSWDFVSDAVSYNLYWLEGNTVTPETGNKISGIATTSMTVMDLANGSTYAFVVTAVNDFGESDASAIKIETPKAALMAPGAPNGVMATPDIGKVTLSWAQVNGATSYTIYYKAGTTVSTTSYDQKITGISTLSYPVSGLSDSSDYAFIVTANNMAGESSASATVTSYAARVAAAKQSLTIGFASVDSADSVTQNLTLATSGLYGTSIIWESNTPATITNMGIVTRPADSDAEVVLTATINIGTVSDIKDFSVKVVKLVPLAAPTVIAISPAGAATGVPIATTITATFSTDMNPGTINEGSFTLRSGTVPVAGTVSYTNNTATFTPTLSLDYSKTYTATVSSTVTDAVGTTMVDNMIWTFTTASAPVAPTITAVWPLANSTGFGLLGTITATFSTSMESSTINSDSFTLWDGSMAVPGTVSYSETSKTAIFLPTEEGLAYSTTYTATVKNTVTATFSSAMNSGTITTTSFTLKAGTTPVAGTVSYNTTTKTATFTPAVSLAYSTTYTATVSTSVTDSAGTAMVSDKIWTFTTAAAPPTVTTVTPVDNAMDIATSTNVTATFSSAMNSGTITTASFTLKAGTMPVAGTVSYNPVSKTATFTPTANLALSTTYTAKISAVVTDSAGTAMVGDKIWTFTTVIPAVAQGKLLVNVVQPSIWSYVYRTPESKLYSVRSIDAGLNWGAINAIDESVTVTDFSADIDNVGNTIVVWTYTSGASYGAKYSRQSAEGGSWDIPTDILAPATLPTTASPSQYRVSSFEILFGVGYDTTGVASDGAGGKTLLWTGTMGPITDAGINYGTDGMGAQQVFKDATGTYYTSMDNRSGWNSMDLYANTTMIVDTGTSNGNQPWILKRTGGVYLVYTSDVGGALHLYYKTATSIVGLLSASSSLLTPDVIKAPSSIQSRTVYAIEDFTGVVHVVFQDLASNSIYRVRLGSDGLGPIGMATLVAEANLDGIAVGRNTTTAQPILIVSAHTDSGVRSIISIENPNE